MLDGTQNLEHGKYLAGDTIIEDDQSKISKTEVVDLPGHSNSKDPHREIIVFLPTVLHLN